jgi:hypothetical protein
MRLTTAFETIWQRFDNVPYGTPMNLWQNVIALGLVLAATAYVAWYLVRAGRRRKSLGCSACTECALPAQRQPLVHIEPTKKRSSDTPPGP